LSFINLVRQHNLLLLASSISYYATLALGPLLLILLSIASLIGEDIKFLILKQVSFLAPNLTDTLNLIFSNLHERVDLGSLSGVLGLIFLIFLSSLVFKQFRFAFDVIHGDYNPRLKKSIRIFLKERFFVMSIGIAMCALFFISLFIVPAFNFLLSHFIHGYFLNYTMNILLNLGILLFIFTGFYFFTPSRKSQIRHCLQMAFITSLGFIIGNFLMSLYMKKLAMQSLFGAAGALFIFLLWTFYSSLIIFLSVEVFEFLRNRGQNRKGPEGPSLFF
jgi:membrane protein